MSEILFPVAISSQLDVTGEERVHAAKYNPSARPEWVYIPKTFLLTDDPSDGGSPILLRFNNTNGTLEDTGSTVGFASSFSSSCTTDGIYAAFGRQWAFTSHIVDVYKRDSDALEFLTTLEAPSVTSPNQLVNAMEFSPDNRFLACGAKGNGPEVATSLFIYERTGDTFSSPIELGWSTPDKHVWFLTWSADSKYLFVATDTPTIGNVFYIFKNTDGVFTEVTSISSRPSVYVRAAQFSPDGTMLVVTTYADANKIWLYDINSTTDTFTFRSALTHPTGGPGPQARAAFTSDGAFMAMAALNGSALFWSVNAGIFTALTSPATTGNISRWTKWTGDDKYLVGCNFGDSFAVYERSGSTLTYLNKFSTFAADEFSLSGLV
jgi:WD40 repeat protein